MIVIPSKARDLVFAGTTIPKPAFPENFGLASYG
jgi:hypothetical protein